MAALREGEGGGGRQRPRGKHSPAAPTEGPVPQAGAAAPRAQSPRVLWEPRDTMELRQDTVWFSSMRPLHVHPECDQGCTAGSPRVPAEPGGCRLVEVPNTSPRRIDTERHVVSAARPGCGGGPAASQPAPGRCLDAELSLNDGGAHRQPGPRGPTRAAATSTCGTVHPPREEACPQTRRRPTQTRRLVAARVYSLSCCCMRPLLQ